MVTSGFWPFIKRVVNTNQSLNISHDMTAKALQFIKYLLYNYFLFYIYYRRFIKSQTQYLCFIFA